MTELVKFMILSTTTNDQLLLAADKLNEFQKLQDGFLDAELVKQNNENEWCFIYHYESFEKVKIIGEALRKSGIFNEFMPLIIPDSLSITFHQPIKKWQK